MEPYQERVIAEQRELDTRIERLEEFLSIQPPPSVPDGYLLSRQLEIMAQYSFILGLRIARFSK